MSSNTASGLEVISLRHVTTEIREIQKQLQAAEQTERVRDAIAALERSVKELGSACDPPDMSIPFAPR